ncbi:ATP-binding cassette domain-containing protein [Microbacterium allomyrinae]|uniref:ABC transporter ATP-binding protein n=1 Tax=Microbacterium allomyrinae TaxID=2830666 RepID=A0A9X1S2W8_9MICO|nr:ABC transporter ATP-binding protein [Microbacterium allomyrinae]MCC2033131.1 ABC transporter ATP-binding protein [Microbacterium allomyrinae]
MTALLELTGITKTFVKSGRAPVVALDDVSLSVEQGEIAGLVGESGSGKSTLIRTIIGLERPDHGAVRFRGVDMTTADRGTWREFRQSVQTVFQDPYSSLDPRMTVERIVGEGLVIHSKAPRRMHRRTLVAEALERVGLAAADMLRYPSSFSGGQRQRIAIARAIVMKPDLLICDEPVSALDVSVQAQVINLLQSMRDTLELTMLFVAHDLAVVRHLCETVSVLEHGKMVEQGRTRDVFDAPRADYTRALIDASPIPDPAAPWRG